jgi:probable F420-dependent oxidoreductase
MKFGLRLPTFAGSPPAGLHTMGAYLRRAEQLGFEAAVTVDRLLTTSPLYLCSWLEPITLLSALAGVTERIRLGTMILVLPLQNPVHVAKAWATLDLLSGGRTIFGVGAGWNEQEFALIGVPRTERGARLDEYLEIIQALWAGDRVTYRGRFSRFENISLQPKPVQQPRPPIWLGGGSQPNRALVSNLEAVLRRVARFADAWVPPASASPDLVRGDWEKILAHAARCQRATHPARVYSNFVHLLKRGERPEAAGSSFRRFSGMDPDYWRTHYLLGEAEEVVEKIRRRIDACGGMEWVVLNPLSFEPDQLERLAGEVMPGLRG